jgi:hypothetical protein
VNFIRAVASAAVDVADSSLYLDDVVKVWS